MLRFVVLCVALVAAMADSHGSAPSGGNNYNVAFNNNVMGGGMGGMGGHQDDVQKMVLQMLQNLAEPPKFLLEIEATFPPYNFPTVGPNGISTGVQGYTVDVINAALKAVGASTEYTISEWAGCIGRRRDSNGALVSTPNAWEVGDRLNFGAFQGCSLATIVPSRALTAGLSLPYGIGMPRALFQLSGANNAVNGALRVAVISGFADDDLLARSLYPDTAGQYTFVPIQEPVTNAFQAVINGQADVFFFDGSAVVDYNNNNPNTQFVAVPNSERSGPTFGMLTKKNAPLQHLFNAGLVSIFTDGSLGRICAENQAKTTVDLFCGDLPALMSRPEYASQIESARMMLAMMAQMKEGMMKAGMDEM